ncbi:MAG: hypothetical protein ABUL44_02295, partial [Flavobacterium sp.]
DKDKKLSEKEKERELDRKDDEKIYNKLVNLYTLDKFEKCIEEADKYVKNENYARSPYPYLYTSMSYLGIHNDQDNHDLKKYKDPLRKALNFMGRFKKKDKEGTFQKENAEFLRDLRKATLLESANLNERKDNKNLQNLARDIVKNYDKDAGMLLIGGTYLNRSEAKIDGDRAIETGMNLLKKMKEDGRKDFDPEQTEQLTQAFTIYTDYLADIKDTSKAKSTIQFAKDLLPDNEKLNKQFDKISKL